MKTAYVTYITKRGKVQIIGPVFSERELAREWVSSKLRIGYNASWVEVGLDAKDFGGYILP